MCGKIGYVGSNRQSSQRKETAVQNRIREPAHHTLTFTAQTLEPDTRPITLPEQLRLALAKLTPAERLLFSTRLSREVPRTSTRLPQDQRNKGRSWRRRQNIGST